MHKIVVNIFWVLLLGCVSDCDASFKLMSMEAVVNNRTGRQAAVIVTGVSLLSTCTHTVLINMRGISGIAQRTGSLRVDRRRQEGIKEAGTVDL